MESCPSCGSVIRDRNQIVGEGKFCPNGWHDDEPRQEPTPKGIWFVYGYDTMPYPMFMSDDEIIARRWQEKLGYYTYIIFWENGTEFNLTPGG